MSGHCRVMVEVTMDACSHKQRVECWEAAARPQRPEACTAKCGVVLADSCGHNCAARCGDCFRHWKHGNRLSATASDGAPLAASRPGPSASCHRRCQLQCGATLFCGHYCTANCHSGRDCPPCSQKCVVYCAHSRCSQPCSKVCVLFLSSAHLSSTQNLTLAHSPSTETPAMPWRQEIA